MRKYGNTLPAGTALLGKVGIDQATANANEVVVKSITAGNNNIGDVDIASALPAGTNLLGKVSIDQVTASANEVVVKSITAGDTNIGNVDIASSLPAGTNLLGKISIDQVTANANEVVVKSVTAGTNLIGKVSIDQATANANEVVVKSRSKGVVTTAHNAITGTTTSASISHVGFNATMVIVTVGAGGGTWKIDVMGCNTTDGTFVDIYDNYDNQLTTGNLTASRSRLFVAVNDYVKIEATEVGDGSTCTVEVQPMNV